jgi:thioredoxin 1
VSELISHVADDTFEAEVLNSEAPVLVDFWAEWCGPCKAIAPVLDQLADAYKGRVKIAKVNVDQNQKTPRNYNIRGIPTLMLFKGGKVEATHIGLANKAQLTKLLDRYI